MGSDHHRFAESESATLRAPAVSGVDLVAGAAVVRLAGELDLHNADEVRRALSEQVERGVDRLVVDMEAVTFVDSTALGVLVETRAKLGRDTAFVLAAPAPEARRALRISGLDRHLTVVDTLNEALAARA